MAIVADSSPLIVFGRVGQLDILRSLFTEVLIPDAVSAEVFAESKTRPGAAAVATAVWIRRSAAPSDVIVPSWLGSLDVGERAALTLAIHLGLPVLIDDLAGRRAAARLGVPVIGSAGALLLAKRRGRIHLVRPTLDALLHGGLRFHVLTVRVVRIRQVNGDQRRSHAAASSAGKLLAAANPLGHNVHPVLGKVVVERERGIEAHALHDSKACSVGQRKVLVRIIVEDGTRPILVRGCGSDHSRGAAVDTFEDAQRHCGAKPRQNKSVCLGQDQARREQPRRVPRQKATHVVGPSPRLVAAVDQGIVGRCVNEYAQAVPPIALAQGCFRVYASAKYLCLFSATSPGPLEWTMPTISQSGSEGDVARRRLVARFGGKRTATSSPLRRRMRPAPSLWTSSANFTRSGMAPISTGLSSRITHASRQPPGCRPARSCQD